MLPDNIRLLYYDIFGNISFVLFIIYNLTRYKEKKFLMSNLSSIIRSFFERKHIIVLSSITFWVVLETILISCVQSLPRAFLNWEFGKLVNTGANYFGLLYFIFFILFIYCTLIWVDPLKQIDMITPAFPLALIFVKIACFSAGCCHGVEWKYGLYNNAFDRVEFPVQLLEAALSLFIFIFLMLLRKKVKEGTMFPIYLIVYSATRFFSEFFRGEESVVWILKRYHILCIIGVILGIIEYIVVKKYGERISNYFKNHRWFIKVKEEK